MDRRQSPRVATWLPVRVWGIDAYELPFVQSATVTNISASGAVLQGMQRQIRPGEILEVQFGRDKAQFRAVWAGKKGSPREGEVGLEALACEPFIWNVELDHCAQCVGTG